MHQRISIFCVMYAIQACRHIDTQLPGGGGEVTLVDAFSHDGSDGHAALFLALEREPACLDHADQDASKLALVVIGKGKVDRKSGGEANVVGQHLFDLVTISRQDAGGRGADG